MANVLSVDLDSADKEVSNGIVNIFQKSIRRTLREMKKSGTVTRNHFEQIENAARTCKGMLPA